MKHTVMTKVQLGLLVVGAAVLFQAGTALAALSTDDLADPKSWAIGAAVGIANSVGVAIVALKTAGGLSASNGG